MSPITPSLSSLPTRCCPRNCSAIVQAFRASFFKICETRKFFVQTDRSHDDRCLINTSMETTLQEKPGSLQTVNPLWMLTVFVSLSFLPSMDRHCYYLMGPTSSIWCLSSSYTPNMRGLGVVNQMWHFRLDIREAPSTIVVEYSKPFLHFSLSSRLIVRRFFSILTSNIIYGCYEKHFY